MNLESQCNSKTKKYFYSRRNILISEKTKNKKNKNLHLKNKNKSHQKKKDEKLKKHRKQNGKRLEIKKQAISSPGTQWKIIKNKK